MIPRISYAAFQAAGADTQVAGKLVLPTREAKPASLAAAVVCHGSDGVDGRGEFHAQALHAAGLATLEIDMWAARGTRRGAAARPASPVETLPDAFGALAFLARQPEIDGTRIGILGFSWGGVVSLLCATRSRADELRGETPRFAGHVALYPVCWAYSRRPALSLDGLTGAPILILTGGDDAYDPPGAAAALAGSLRAQSTAHVQWTEYEGAGHGFDRDLPAQTIVDPFAHGGVGGEVVMAFSPSAATAARTSAAAFLAEALGASRVEAAVR